MKKYRSLVIFIGGLLLGVGVSFFFRVDTDFSANQVRQGGYALINPLLECNLADQLQTEELKDLEMGLREHITKLKARGLAKDVSVYFRGLNNGPTFGINEKVKFAPASLLKLPVMMAYYRQAERGEVSLASKAAVLVEEDMNTWETFTSENYVKIGESYTHEELIRAMMVSSDNNAMAALMNNISTEEEDQIYEDLGIKVPSVENRQDFMTVKEYASFFRILYNASYLSKEYSERALQLLTEVEFRDGLVAGVDPNVKVSHKFGERVQGDILQLHDCGIVYLEKRPYLLCVMTRGDDFSKLTETIKNISSYVYQDLSSR